MHLNRLNRIWALLLGLKKSLKLFLIQDGSHDIWFRVDIMTSQYDGYQSLLHKFNNNINKKDLRRRAFFVPFFLKRGRIILRIHDIATQILILLEKAYNLCSSFIISYNILWILYIWILYIFYSKFNVRCIRILIKNFTV